MTNTPRNPPAYPTGDHIGMHLRDAFALAAMQGLASAHTSDGEWTGYDLEHTAKWAYEMADAMLAERDKKPR